MNMKFLIIVSAALLLFSTVDGIEISMVDGDVKSGFLECDISLANIHDCVATIPGTFKIHQDTEISNVDIICKQSSTNFRPCILIYPGINVKLKKVTLSGSGFNNFMGLYKSATLTMEDATLNGWDGPTFIKSDNAHINIINSIFTNNSVRELIEISQSKINLVNTTFSNNVVSGAGSLISASTSSIVNLANLIFSGNAVSGTGSLISAFNSDYDVNLANTTFSNNDVKTDGGALYIEDSGANIDQCNFHLNSAQKGGAIHFYVGSHGIFGTITNSVIKHNFAYDGESHGIYCEGTDQPTFYDDYATIKVDAETSKDMDETKTKHACKLMIE